MNSLLTHLSFLVCAYVLHAQSGSYNNPPADLGYPPPAGWTFVNRIDSVDRHDYYLSMRGDNIHLRYNKVVPVNLFSTDGGISWDTLRYSWLPKEIQKEAYGNNRIPFGVFDSLTKTYISCIQIFNGTTISTVVTNRKLNTGTTYVTSDFGKTIEVYPMDNLSIAMIHGSRYTESIFNHPSDNKRYFIKLSNQLGFNTIEYLWQTTDGGATWRYLRMPDVPSYNKYKINDIVFNVQHPNDWWQVSIYTDVIEYQCFETHDGGQTYRWIPTMGVFDSTTWRTYPYGLWGFPEDNTRRALFSIYTDTLYYKYGVNTWQPIQKSKHLISATPNERDSAYKSSLLPNWADRIWKTLTDTSKRKFIIEYYPNFGDTQNAYVTGTVGTVATRQKNSEGFSGIFRTTDDGESWNEIFSLPLTTNSGRKLGYNFTTNCIDTTNNSAILAIKEDFDYIGSTHLDIWKKINFITNVENTVQLSDAISVSPNPTDKSLMLRIPEFITIQSVKVCNLLGQILIDNPISGTETKQINISVSDLPNGLYFIILKNNETTKQIPIIVSH